VDINNFFQSKTFKIITWCVAGFIVLFFVFNLGVFVGTQKASFSFRWAEQYHNNFAGPANGFFQQFAGKDFIDSNGVFGKIIKVADQSIIVKGKDDVEKIVSITDKTTIKYQNKDIKISDLKIDDEVVIIGEPNDAGQIEAKLIRVMPPLPTAQTQNNQQNIQTQVELNSI
jgi:5S rRNA maturation endonuclease (ribonuclease M5)